MTLEHIKMLFEEHYNVGISKDGIKKLHQHFSRFDDDIIEDALQCCFDQYEDAHEAFDKLGGICHNKSVEYLEDQL